MTDFHSVLNRLLPKQDGEQPVKYRKGIVAGVGSGVVDVLLSGVVVPDVAIHGTASVSDEVHLLVWPGDLLAIGECGGGGGGCGSCNLGDLLNVDTSGQAQGDMLYYNGTTWVLVGGTKTTGFVPTIQGSGAVAWQAAGGGGGSGWMDRVVPFGTPTAQDDYFDGGSLDAKWTLVTVTGSNTVTVSAGTMLASVIANGQTNNDINCILQSHSLAQGDMIAVALRFMGSATANGMLAGVILTDGTAGSSNAAWFGFDNFTVNLTGAPSHGRILDRSGTLTNMATSAAQISTPLVGNRPWLWVGLEYEAANTFRKWMSVDGVTWSRMGTSDFTPTLTPSHIGIGWSTMGTGELQASFAAFRRFTV